MGRIKACGEVALGVIVVGIVLFTVGLALNLAVDIVATRISRNIKACAAEMLTAPAGYERARVAIPDRHWSHVASVQIDRTSGGQSRREDMSVHLTPYRSDGQLWHEVGHIVYYSNPEIEREWQAQIWRDGKPSEALVSKYAATNHREAFAEAYKEFLEHGQLEQSRQDAFMRRYVFEPHEVPRRG